MSTPQKTHKQRSAGPNRWVGVAGGKGQKRRRSSNDSELIEVAQAPRCRKLIEAAKGVQLNHIYGIISKGALGNVFACRLAGGLVAAIKIAHCTSAEADHLQHEAAMYELAASLQGVHIPRLLASGVGFGGRAYVLATELIQGEVLDPGSDAHKKLHPQARQALLTLHAAGLEHGDLRENNTLVNTKIRKVTLIDLHMARASKSGAARREELECLAEMFGSPAVS